jgi:hypothetical protein
MNASRLHQKDEEQKMKYIAQILNPRLSEKQKNIIRKEYEQLFRKQKEEKQKRTKLPGWLS